MIGNKNLLGLILTAALVSPAVIPSVAQSHNKAWRLPVTARPSSAGASAGGQTLAGGRTARAIAAPSPRRIMTTDSGAEIWGSLISTNGGQQPGSFEGMYSFSSAADNTSADVLCKGTDLMVNGGYAYKQSYSKENFLYYITYGEQNGQVSAHYYIYSTDTWKKNDYSEEVNDPGRIALDVDLDKASGESYGCFYNSAGTGYEWAKMNYSTFEDKATIKSLTKALYAVAIDPDGQAYGIDEDGDLVKIDKATGDQTVVGATGYKPRYLQSMAFDPSTCILYWAGTLTNGQSSLFEVSTATGAATLIKHFPNDEEYTALYIPTPPAGGAPAKVSNLKGDFPNGSLSGNVTFTAPTTTVDGEALDTDSPLNYYIVGEKFWGLDTLSRGTVKPGDDVKVPFSYSLSDEETFIVMTRNDVGFSAKSTLKVYVGHDTPAAPANVNLTYDKQAQNAVLTWSAPTVGSHGGYVDPKSMTYTVVRYPDGATVASSTKDLTYTEQLKDTLGKEFYYGVSATYDYKTGAEGVSNHLKFASAADTVSAKIPQAPHNVVLAEEDDDVFRLTWNAPENVADSASLTYYIYQVGEDGRQTPIDTLVNGTTEWTTVLSSETAQNYVYYRVAAHNEYGTSPDARSNLAVYGRPYRLPYHESVAGGAMATWVWSADEGDASFGVGSDAEDGDAGAFAASLSNGQSAGMTSPKISLAGSTRPKLVFWSKLSNATLIPVVKAYGQAPRELPTIDAGNGEWKQSIIDLADFTSAKYLRISFRAEASADSASAVIDNIDVLNVKDVDLAVTSIAAPASVQTGHKVVLTVNVRNLGNNVANSNDYRLDLYVNGKVDSSAKAAYLPALESMAEKAVDIEYDIPAVGGSDELDVYAKVVIPGDGDSDNDFSEVKTIKVVPSTLPAVTGLSASATGDATTLTWIAPEIGDQLQVTDDFESYEHWTTSNLSPWTALDIDHGKGYDISIDGTELHFPHATEAFGFLAFDASDYTSFPTLAAHSGSQYLAAFSPSSYYVPQANDWLISPELSGKQQTVSVWARSYLATGEYSYPETFEILYSSTDTARSSFTRPEGGLFNDIPDSWTEYSVSLPEGAKYFAIHYISADKFAAFFDDATYSIAAPELLGYVVFRDGEPVDTLSASSASWTDNSGTTASSSYSVIAVYSTGSSAPVFVSTPTGISVPVISADTEHLHSNSPSYNLSGQRVGSSYKGVVIRNGHKFIAR